MPRGRAHGGITAGTGAAALALACARVTVVPVHVPEVSPAPVPTAKRLDATPAAPRNVFGAFKEAVDRANDHCAFHVTEYDNTEFEASSQARWCFDDEFRVRLVMIDSGAEGHSGWRVYVVENDRLACAQEREDDNGSCSESTYCEGVGGEVTAPESEARALSAEERARLLREGISHIRGMILSDDQPEGGCSESIQLERTCYGEGVCHDPQRGTTASPELCPKRDVLYRNLERVSYEK